MGVSTDAVLAYGIDLGADEDLMDGPLGILYSDSEGFSLDLLIEETAGLGPEPDYEQDRDAWRAWRDALRKAEESYPLQLVEHCSNEYGMRFLAVRGTVLTAPRGYPQRVAALPTPTDEQMQALRTFCERFEVDDPQPAFQLFSYWG
jgi:hypothetical protein